MFILVLCCHIVTNFFSKIQLLLRVKLSLGPLGKVLDGMLIFSIFKY